MLITGANGFVGSAARKFFKKEYDVYGIDIIGNQDEKTYIVDIKTEQLGVILNKIVPDVVIHAAGGANVSYSIAHPQEDFDNSVRVFYNMIETLHKLNIRSKVIFLSSAAVYGNVSEKYIGEKTEVKPISPYGLHKKLCEDIADYYAKQYQMDITILRVFSVYGPGLKKQIMWDMYQKYIKNGKIELFGTGEEARDFIYIEDLIRCIDCILQSKVQNGVYNIANGRALTIKSIAEIFATELSGKAEVYFNHVERKGDPEYWCANINAIKELGYEQKVDIHEGIRRYISWAQGVTGE